ncbi:ABC transporter permease [Blastopirellula retiformator]|uniref:Putative D,D-dipeptide transport system permease protein DdpC n=1 Tax=Blastopirellula retiformator TaxID=2527970 RepID=A0A5C5V0C6_9BACT|nr:ABC transporter permease [Blastopirellula retiformator]TWT32094.1 putative D,D-dipeptide transport system permease protein DdpC [Blastopirellula retiformator]
MSSEPAPNSPTKERESYGFWRESWRNFRKRPQAMAALAFVGFLALVALTAPMIVGTRPIVCEYKGEIHFPCTYYYYRILGLNSMAFKIEAVFTQDKFRGVYPGNLKEKDPDSWAIWPLVYQDPYRAIEEGEWPDQPENPYGGAGQPNSFNLLGTNLDGVDVFAQMVHATQISLLVGIVSMGIAATIGIVVGALAGFYGGWVDIILSRVIEMVMCLPTLVLILAVRSILDDITIWHLMVLIGITGWTSVARLTRGEFMKIREIEYVSAARSLGAGQFRLMFVHILRNALAPILVPISFGIASAILTEGALSFLGFGAPPPNPSWGTLLKEGSANIQSMWWLVLFPGLAIFFTVLAYNLIGEGVQEATDPRTREGA